MSQTVKAKMTREEYTAKVGRPPQQDDLDRVNCAHAGEPGHFSCGWCSHHDGPRSACSCGIETIPERAS